MNIDLIKQHLQNILINSKTFKSNEANCIFILYQNHNSLIILNNKMETNLNVLKLVIKLHFINLYLVLC